MYANFYFGFVFRMSYISTLQKVKSKMGAAEWVFIYNFGSRRAKKTELRPNINSA